MNFWNRIGLFFLVAGLMTLAVFLATDAGGTPQFRFLLWGGGGVVAGFWLLSRGRKPRESGRFSSLRQMRNRAAEQKKASKKPRREQQEQQ